MRERGVCWSLGTQVTYQIKTLSVSKVTGFDHSQKGGCERRSVYDFPLGQKEEQTASQGRGEGRHHLTALHLAGKELPTRYDGLKAVKRVIASGILPAPGPDLLIERRFSGQDKYDAKGDWVELDTSKTLWLGGVPWEGFVDVQYRRNGLVSVEDHKFADVVEDWLPAERLIRTVQMPVYGWNAFRIWPDAREVQLVHNYSTHNGKQTERRAAIVSRAQIEDRIGEIEPLTKRLITTWTTFQNVEDVPANPGPACDAWAGCPHQSKCSAFKKRFQAMQENDLTDEEKAMFGIPITPKEAAPVTAPPAQQAATPPPAPPAAVTATPAPVADQIPDSTSVPPPPQPSRKPRKAKQLIEDLSTTPDATKCGPELQQGAVYRLTGGEERQFLCSTEGGYSFAALNADNPEKIKKLPEGTPVVFVRGPTKDAPPEAPKAAPVAAAPQEAPKADAAKPAVPEPARAELPKKLSLTMQATIGVEFDPKTKALISALAAFID
jgi:hypothetical protein